MKFDRATAIRQTFIAQLTAHVGANSHGEKLAAAKAFLGGKWVFSKSRAVHRLDAFTLRRPVPVHHIELALLHAEGIRRHA